MTPTELKLAALRELRIIPAGEPDAPAEYLDIASDKYSTLYEMLATERLVTWASTDDIPSDVAQPITMMLAFLCAGPFGVNPGTRAELEQAGALNLPAIKGGPSLAESQLRRALARSYVSSPATSEYF